jgi:hypothetical protein
MLMLQIFDPSYSSFSFCRHSNMGLLLFIVFINLISASLGAEPASNSLHPTLSSVTASSVTAAKASDTSNTSYAPPLFHSETIQLTEQDLVAAAAEIQNATISDLFSFGAHANNTSATSGRSHSCKLLPGDLSWPGNDTWKAFNSVLGGSLIRTVPLAASCYADWPEYNADICTAVTEQWLNSNLQ